MMVHFDNKEKCNFWKRRKKVEIEILEIGEIFTKNSLKFLNLSWWVGTYLPMYIFSNYQRLNSAIVLTNKNLASILKSVKQY